MWCDNVRIKASLQLSCLVTLVPPQNGLWSFVWHMKVHVWNTNPGFSIWGGSWSLLKSSLMIRKGLGAKYSRSEWYNFVPCTEWMYIIWSVCALLLYPDVFEEGAELSSPPLAKLTKLNGYTPFFTTLCHLRSILNSMLKAPWCGS